MALDPVQMKKTTRQHWPDYASGWNACAPLLEIWPGEAIGRMLDLAGVTTGRSDIDVAAAVR